jgi:hypothetical protein
MDWLQILELQRDCNGKLKMNADGKAIEWWGVLQEIGDPKKATHANGMFQEGGPAMSNNSVG